MEIVDYETGESVAGRISFAKSPKKVTRPNRLMSAGSTWLVESKFPLSLANGEYAFSISRGPEFKEMTGGFTIEPRGKDIVTVQVPRTVNMHEEHWYSGDLSSKLPIEILRRWQQADAVDFTSTTTAPDASDSGKSKESKNENPPDDDSPNGLAISMVSRKISWDGGSVQFHEFANPRSSREDQTKQNQEQKVASLLRELNDHAREREKATAGTMTEILEPWHRDVPLLLATEGIDAVQLLSMLQRPTADATLTTLSIPNLSGTLRGTIGLIKGKTKWETTMFAPIPADEEIRYKDGRATGRLVENLYWKMLEAGFKITPTAGSDFGLDDTRVGYNRVYAYCDKGPDAENWCKSVRSGKTIVTNGPLLRAKINGQPPGTTLASYRGTPITLDIEATLSVRDPVDYLDVIFNGQTLYSAKLEEHLSRGEFPPIEVDQSGWLVVRVITGQTKGYRMATTAPFYIEFDGHRRISRSSVAFLQKWFQISKLEWANAQELKGPIQNAADYWQRLLLESNAD